MYVVVRKKDIYIIYSSSSFFLMWVRREEPRSHAPWHIQSNLRGSYAVQRHDVKSQLPLVVAIIFASVAIVAAQGPCDIYEKVAPPASPRTLWPALSTLGMLDRSISLQNMMEAPRMFTPYQWEVWLYLAHDSFCGRAATSKCFVRRIYDQSPRQNHLGIEHGAHNLIPPRNVQDNGVNFTDPRSKAKIGDHLIYGAFFAGDVPFPGQTPRFQGQGYSNRTAQGTARGDEAQSLYALFGGGHYGGGCCFDYGNAENVNGSGQAGPMYNGSMEAIYFQFGRVGADLENGIYATRVFEPIDFRAAFVKGRPGNHYSVRSGDAQTAGSLTTIHAGPRPKGYEISKKQGGIVLGIGGDNSPWAAGIWYEGLMTTGYVSDATEAAVMANVVAADFKL